MTSATRGFRLSYHVAASRDGLLMASDDFDSDFEPELADTLKRFFGSAPSLRALSRQSGIPYSTLQGIASGNVTNPSQRTIDRITDATERLPVRRSVRSRTYADDTEVWTPSKLANLEPPRGSSAWRLVVRVRGTNSGVASTPWRALSDSHPSDLLLGGDLTPNAVLRVVWDRQ